MAAIVQKNLNYILIMGKLFHGALGRVKGSVGNTTYRRIYGVANASAVYDKVLEVANPKTGNQILQRAKLQPAQRFYEAYKSVLNHCLQGRQPGEITRRAWLSMHMKNDFRRHSYVPKGWEGIVASPYVVSKGVLPTVGPAQFEDLGFEYDVPVFGLNYTASEGEMRSVDVMSAALVAANPDRLQIGDELTFLFLVTDDFTGPEAYPLVVSFVIDPNAGGEVPLKMGGNEYGNMYAQPLAMDVDTYTCVAAACIHSRKVGDSWQYSTENMSLRVDYQVDWTNSRAFNAMMSSYGAEGYNTTNGRRVLQQASNQPYNGKITKISAMVAIEASGDLPAFSGDIEYLGSLRQNVSSSKQADNVSAVFYREDKGVRALVDANGEVVKVKQGETDVVVTPVMINYSGNLVEWFPEYIEQVV